MSAAAPGEPVGCDAGDPAPARRWTRARRLGSIAATVAAAALVWIGVIAPHEPAQLHPAAFVRLPIEGLIAIVLCVALPRRAGRICAALTGLTLGILAIVAALDVGFRQELDRPFNPVTDRTYLGPAYGVLRDSIGGTRAVIAAGAISVAVVGILVLMPWAMVRVTDVAASRRRPALRAAGGLAGAWLLLAALGIGVAGGPVASSSAADLAYDQIRDARAALEDQRQFAAALAAPDPMAAVPDAQLLSALRGKDVIIAFVESYGRVAVQDSDFSPGVRDVLSAGTQQLAEAGFGARSAFLTSPTFGGISWLAHSTLQSGLWIDNQLRYNTLVDSDRLTLSRAFGQAGWRTVGDVPSNAGDWPEGSSFYGYDQLYNGENVGYAGPAFSYASMPDQYTLAAFARNELDRPNRGPVMAEIDLVSSHTPWTPLPSMVPWADIGDGSLYDGMPDQGLSPSEAWRDAGAVRQLYGQSIEYSMSSLVSFVQQANDDNLVLIALGDHQPATIVSGANASRDVPISIVARDPAVLDRVAAWGWQAGLLPGPDAPVTRMDAFRDRFIASFSQ